MNVVFYSIRFVNKPLSCLRLTTATMDQFEIKSPEFLRGSVVKTGWWIGILSATRICPFYYFLLFNFDELFSLYRPLCSANFVNVYAGR
jgi:hypothetical protein